MPFTQVHWKHRKTQLGKVGAAHLSSSASEAESSSNHAVVVGRAALDNDLHQSGEEGLQVRLEIFVDDLVPIEAEVLALEPSVPFESVRHLSSGAFDRDGRIAPRPISGRQAAR